jgi:hypothetical protein
MPKVASWNDSLSPSGKISVPDMPRCGPTCHGHGYGSLSYSRANPRLARGTSVRRANLHLARGQHSTDSAPLIPPNKGH